MPGIPLLGGTWASGNLWGDWNDTPEKTCLLVSLKQWNSKVPPLRVGRGRLMIAMWVGAGVGWGLHFESYCLYWILDLHLWWTGGWQWYLVLVFLFPHLIGDRWAIGGHNWPAWCLLLGSGFSLLDILPDLDSTSRREGRYGQLLLCASVVRYHGPSACIILSTRLISFQG